MDKLNKIVLKIMEFNEMLLTKVSPNMKILFGFKSIFESIQQFARYRIGALILIEDGSVKLRSKTSRS